MEKEQPIVLNMSDISKQNVDLVNQVVSFENTVWCNPYNHAKSITDQTNNYSKYSKYLANMLYLQAEPHYSAYQGLMKRAIENKILVFECTCFPNPCHLDAIRERLTKDLEAKGFKIISNQGPIQTRKQTDED